MITPTTDKIALISDPHGNSPALRAVLDDIRQQGCRRLLVLGDVINGIDPQGCLDLLRGWEDAKYVRGNAEAYVLTPNLEALPRQDDPMNRSLIPLIRWFQAHISEADLRWIQTWPDHLFEGRACLVHDSPFNRFFPETWHDPELPDEYQEWFYHGKGIYKRLPEDEQDALFTWMGGRGISHVFCGHTHDPVSYTQNDRVICNVGSVGIPLDGDPRACWVMWQPGISGQDGLTLHRVEYNIELLLQMVTDDPTFHAEEPPANRQAYLKMLATGIHWKVHLREFDTQ